MKTYPLITIIIILFFWYCIFDHSNSILYCSLFILNEILKISYQLHGKGECQMLLHQLLKDCRYTDTLVPIQSHHHNDYELIYIKSGIAHIKIESKVYRLQSGSLVFINQLENHAITVLSNNYERFYVIFNSERLGELLSEPRFKNFNLFFNIFSVSAFCIIKFYCFCG